MDKFKDVDKECKECGYEWTTVFSISTLGFYSTTINFGGFKDSCPNCGEIQ